MLPFRNTKLQIINRNEVVIMKWTKAGFLEFSKGRCGNSGQNLYVSAKGVLQRIFQFDLNGDGYPDLPISNSHSMNERPPVYVFDKAGQEKPLELPSNGSFDACFVDLYDRGIEDLVIACQNDGVHNDISAIIYFGSEVGLSEKYKMQLRAPNATAVVAGRFDGGKKALAFVCDKIIRVFYQTEKGIEASKFTDLNIRAVSIAAGDLDGDGYDDLYVILQDSGEMAVFWGGPDGISADRVTRFGKSAPILFDRLAVATTAGRSMFRWYTWRCSVVKMHERYVTFRVEDHDAVFESFDSNRQAHEEIRVHCKEVQPSPSQYDAYFFGYGPICATSGDLRSDGSSDIIIATATDFETKDDAIILWEKENYSPERAGKLPLRCPKSLSVGPFGDDGKNCLLVGESCHFESFDVEAEIYRFAADGSAELVASFPAREPTRVLSGKTYSDGRHQIAVINHEGETKLGLEDVWIYLGGPDGYSPERKLAFPGHSTVDTIMADFNDDGRTDVLLVNCAENAGYLSPGSTIFWADEKGFDTKNNRTDFHACVMSHGVAIGDFRKCGYLDIITGGIHSRELRIFEGGPKGYDVDHPRTIALGPGGKEFSEKFVNVPMTYKTDSDKQKTMTSEFMKEYAEVRWMLAADFNSDGYLDVFVSEIAGSRSYIFWGGPNGISADNYLELATDGVGGANVADLNGNGYPDLILACHQCLKASHPRENSRIVIYWGGPDGYQEYRKTELPSPCTNAVTIQDFNNDGLLDIYATAYSNGRCRDIDSKMYFQTADRVFHIQNFQNIFNHSGCGCMSGDFNGDGYIDLAVASHKAFGNHVNDSYIFWGGPDGINENRYTALPGRGPHGMCSVDIGNIMDRSDSEYYTSEAYFIPEGERPIRASWVATNASKTWVKMQVRCAKKPEELENAAWSDKLDNGAGLEDMKLEGYLQYRLELGATCGCGTPRVSEVTIEFEKK